ncbi:hypothetical protein LLG95_12130 [bacterium]|nr:hypothetical protein [bacterium]
MREKTSRRWLKRIILGISVVFAMVAFQISLFYIHSIPKELETPPPKLLKMKSTSGATHFSMDVSVPRMSDTKEYLRSVYRARRKLFLDYVRARHPDSPIALYDQFMEQFDRNIFSDFTDLFFQQDAGKPFNDAQKKWLIDRHGAIQMAVKLADAGGCPTIACEDIASLPDEELIGLSSIHYPLTMPFILDLESKRLRDEGNAAGAAKMILAADTLIRSMSQPDAMAFRLSRGALSYVVQDLTSWIETSMTPEIALMLRDKLAAPRIDPRKPYELRYRDTRWGMIQQLNASFRDIFQEMYTAPYPPFSTEPAKTDKFLDAALFTIRTKASADLLLREYDVRYEKFCEVLDAPNSAIALKNADRDKYAFFFKERFHLHEDFLQIADYLFDTEAELNLVLAAMDTIIDPSGKNPITRIDPYTKTPLKKIDKPDAIVIYSVGPNGTDQRGLVKQNSMSLENEGDIVIRIPKQK